MKTFINKSLPVRASRLVRAGNIERGFRRWEDKLVKGAHHSGLPNADALSGKWAIFSQKMLLSRDLKNQVVGSYSAAASLRRHSASSVFTPPASRRLEDRTAALQENIQAYLNRVDDFDYAPFWGKIRSFAQFNKGWDSHGAEPISSEAREGARGILRILEARRLPVIFLTATSDESILLKGSIGDASATWEIDHDGEIGVMVERPGHPLRFESVNLAAMSAFVADLEQDG